MFPVIPRIVIPKSIECLVHEINIIRMQQCHFKFEVMSQCILYALQGIGLYTKRSNTDTTLSTVSCTYRIGVLNSPITNIKLVNSPITKNSELFHQPLLRVNKMGGGCTHLGYGILGGKKSGIWDMRAKKSGIWDMGKSSGIWDIGVEIIHF